MCIIELSSKAPCVCGWNTPDDPSGRRLDFFRFAKGSAPSFGIDCFDRVRYSYEITVRVESARTSVYLPKVLLGVERKGRITAGLQVSSARMRSTQPRKDVRELRKMLSYNDRPRPDLLHAN